MRNNGRLSLTAVFLAAALLIIGCSMPKDAMKNPGISKPPEDAKNEFGPGYSRYKDPDLMVEVSYMSPASLDVYFSRFHGGEYNHMFPPTAFVVFAVEVENKGDKSVTFNPRMTNLLVGKANPVSATDYSSYYSDLVIADADHQEKRAEAFKVACYDSTETIEPGGRIRKLIVYPRREDMTGAAAIMFNGLYVGHEGRAIVITYPEDVGLD